jgi:hypothetical protein
MVRRGGREDVGRMRLEKQAFFQDVGLQNAISGKIAVFIAAPHDMGNEVYKLKVQILLALLGNLFQNGGGIHFEPKLYLQLLNKAVATRHLDSARIGDEVHHSGSLDLIENGKADHVVIEFVWIRLDVGLNVFFLDRDGVDTALRMAIEKIRDSLCESHSFQPVEILPFDLKLGGLLSPGIDSLD